MATESVTVDNPYGIGALWAQGDFVAKGVMVLLVIMSAYSWFIIFTKWWEQRRLLSQAHEAEKNFWADDNIKAGLSKLSGKGNIFKGMAAEAIDAAEHHDTRLTQQVPPVSYTHLRAHETVLDLVCRLLLEKKNIKCTRQMRQA